MNYNEELEKLVEQIARKSHYEKLMENLKLQHIQLKRKTSDLEAIKNKEQTDVDKLEGRSLAALFYAIRGKKEEILEAERQEAYIAAIKFDTAKKELQAVEDDIADCELKLMEISDMELRYEHLLAEKSESVKGSDPETSLEIENLEKDIAKLKRHEKELTEALEAGKKAQYMAESIYQTLRKAENWSTWDIFGGGLISDIVKHEHLDGAQSQIEMLQVLLRKFQNELLDVKINSDIKVNVDGFLGFADFFFDGIFVDLTIKHKIEDSLITIQRVESQIKSIICKLESDIQITKRKCKNTQKQINSIIYNYGKEEQL